MAEGDLNKYIPVLEEILAFTKQVRVMVEDMRGVAQSLARISLDLNEIQRDMQDVKAMLGVEEHKSLPVHLAHGHA